MSYYDNQQWAASNSPAWEQQTPPVRSGASSTVPRESPNAFATQIEEIDRAFDNLIKSGKIFNLAARRESLSIVGGPPRTFTDQTFDPRICGPPTRHHSVSDFGDARSYSASNLQSFYATQRHQPSRVTNEAEQMMQAKRRMAAQRERELRNYHQEQQYNRRLPADPATFGGQPDCTINSSNGIKEEERRDLIARQRSALYSENSSYAGESVFDDNGNRVQGSISQPTTSLRGHSPRTFEKFNAPASTEGCKSHGDSQTVSGPAPGQSRSRANSVSSPTSNPPNCFSLFDATAQQSSRTSNSSPGESPSQGCKPLTNTGVAPIGTRPCVQGPNLVLNKRSTTPLPSPLSFGFAPSEGNSSDKKEVRNNSAHKPNSQPQQEGGLVWAKGSVWGNRSSLSVQAPVWG
ncbi:hypothetical protein K3495_g9021 [Podosphaera aphanis]|nr:hypothetical protein K3495_g9021 [Podosphaera aphanis]